MISMGIDPSTKRTGVAVTEMRKDKLVVLHKCSITEDGKGMNRALVIATKVAGLIEEWKPEAVAIEGYAFGNKFSLGVLVELGTMIRYAIMSSGRWYIDPAPNTLKKFVTGSGKVEKNKMILEVYKRWGIEAANDDEVDAISLAAFALAYTGHLTVANKTSREAIMTCRKTVLAIPA